MKLPFHKKPVYRNLFLPSSNSNSSGIMPSARKQDITGMATCKKNGNVLFTGSATICAKPTHSNCTSAKVAAVNSIAANCKAQGGVPSQSTNRCSYGAKC